MSLRIIAPLAAAEPPEERYLVYLDRLRKSGVINMFFVAPELTAAFPELDLPEARHVLAYWMTTFSRRNHIEEA